MIMVRNNIEFRKTSSIAISKFKQHEYFILGEMTEGKTTFNRTSKEIMLLKFRLWSRWLCEIEDMIAFLPGNEILGKDIDYMLYTMTAVDHKYTTSICDNTHLFDEKQSKCWLEVHKVIAYSYLVDEVKTAEGMTKSESFEVVVSAVIEAMLMGMYELWEISLIMDDKAENKLAYTNMSHICQDTEKSCYLGQRALIYNQYFGVTEFMIENYSSDEVYLSGAALKKINNSGITIRLKESENDT